MENGLESLLVLLLVPGVWEDLFAFAGFPRFSSFRQVLFGFPLSERWIGEPEKTQSC